MSDPSAGIVAWKRETSAFDRVQSVASTVSQPRPASHIAEQAHVAENTARDHLERLVDLNILLKSDDKGTTYYSPDPLHTRIQTLRDLLDRHDRNGLIQLKADLQEQIEGWHDKYGVDSPDALRDRAAATDTAADTRDIKRAVRDWELVEYRLSIVEDAIENYTTYTKDLRASA